MDKSKISFIIVKSAAQLKGDSARVRQILVNLLGNAVKFTESGSIKLTIKALEVVDDCVTLEFSISDTGCGIKKEDIGKLFEMFQQVDTTRNRGKEGTGLGLAISKQLAELRMTEDSKQHLHHVVAMFVGIHSIIV